MLSDAFFDTDGMAHIRGRLHFPRLRFDALVQFHIDTESARTTLAPTDSNRHRLDYSMVAGRGEEKMIGFGGSDTVYL